MTGSGDILVSHDDGVSTITMNRPAALNALTWRMVQRLSLQLAAWRDDPGVAAVLVKAAPGRAFCAGGDIRAVTDLVREQGVTAATAFFREEYRLNWRIHTFPKPYLAVLDGITMGGGVGISVHGSHRVVTERTLLAMPETGIGFIPDVGATWFLPRCPGAVGMYLGLTGARLNGADTLAAGLGTHAVPAARLAELEDMLAVELRPDKAQGVVTACLGALADGIGPTELPQLRPSIDACFGADSTAEIFRRLEADPGEFAAEQLAALATKSPLAVALTFAQLKRGRSLSIEDALRLEYRVVHRLLAGHDFHEGVRALLIDKDRRPRWRHRDVAAVPGQEVEACLAPLPEGELVLDWHGL